jgi:hypothetical protein
VFSGQFLDYLDNSPHLAELRSMAHSNLSGWSEFAFLGFPVGLMQSPVIYPSLALLTRWGAPLEIMYSAATVLGVFAPAAALWWVMRERLGSALALIPAATLLTFRGSLVGVTASLGGMFPFHFAAAAFIILSELLARKGRTAYSPAYIALLTALIGLTHLFVTIALVYLAVVHVAWSMVAGHERRARLWFDIPALALGAIAAAAYWLPNAMSHTRPGFESTGIYGIAERFLSATTGPRLSGHWVAALMRDPIWHMDILVQALPIMLVGFGLRSVIRGEDDLPRYGLSLSVLLFGLLMTQRILPLPLMGPQGVRLVYFIKIGLLVACVPAILALSRGNRLRWRWVLGAASVVLLAIGSERVVASHAINPHGADIADVHELWAWLREHHKSDWGRIYLRNTCWRDLSSLYESHILARTAEATGLEQFGAYYDIPSYADRDWALYTVEDDDPHLIEKTARNMTLGNATHLVLHGAAYLARLDRSPLFDRVATVNRFAIYRLRAAVSRWTDVQAKSTMIEYVREAPGRMKLATSNDTASITLKESFHPFFRTEPPQAAHLSPDRHGRMVVTAVQRNFHIVYTPPRWPWLVSAIGFLAIAFLPKLLRSTFDRMHRRQVSLSRT